MEVKGTAVASIPRFIEERFGSDNFNTWLNSLSSEAKSIYSSNILPSKWYNLKTILEEPTHQMCSLFYNGNNKGAWEAGKASAEYGLKGILKIFVKMGSPTFIISRATTILPSYYQPSELKIISSTSNSLTIQITQFPELSEITENRIGGWMEKALEIQGCKLIKVQIVKSVAKGDKICEYLVSWKQ